MNANELADELKEIALISDNHTKIVLGIAETMLRQQQAEIEALKAAKIRAYDNGVEDGRKPDTNLVKELTDEEILECWNETHPAVVCLNAELPLFAKAILKKAQEK